MELALILLCILSVLGLIALGLIHTAMQKDRKARDNSERMRAEAKERLATKGFRYGDERDVIG